MTLKAKLDDLRMQQAADWLQLLREGRREANADFVEWVAESPANLRAFLTMDALSQASRAALKKVPPQDRAALLSNSELNVVELTGAADPATWSNRIRGPGFGRHRQVWALAASLGIVAVVALWQFGLDPAPTPYVTGAAQQRTIDLPDGSIVYLNARSEVAVRLTDRERSIKLTRGEALFQVARDTRRPFRVRTRDAIVEAVGTQFSVNTRADGTHVAVVEGKVKVSRGNTAVVETEDGPSAGLAAGESAQITRTGRIERRRDVDVRQAIAWSQPELIFEGTSLEEAVGQFNRHRRATPIRLIGVQPDSHHYTGIFNATDAESFAALLEMEPDLVIETRAGEIVIRGKTRRAF